MPSDDERVSEIFLTAKEQTLKRADLSLKGSIDEPIRDLVGRINASQHYYTTSTCSGRITLIEKPLSNSGAKKGNKFLMSSHQEIGYEDFFAVICSFLKSETSTDIANTAARDCLWLKFEPFILHVQCSGLAKARFLLNIALGAGNRNSGITLGRGDKFMVAVRSTSSMEVPVGCASLFKLEENYLKFLWSECNRRLAENAARLAKFHATISEALSS